MPSAGNACPVVLTEEKGSHIAFITYFKGEFGVHTLERKEPLQTALVSDFGEAGGGLTDFQAPLTHTLVQENKKKKGTFEKLFLDGRPPVNVGVTSGGDIFGGTQITFSDVLGDKQFNFFAASISQYRTISGSYVNLSRRFQYALQGFSQTDFFYGQLGGVFYDPCAVADHRSRSRAGDAHDERRQRLRDLAVQPLSPRSSCRPASSTSTRSSAIRRWSSTRRTIRNRSTASSCSTTARRVPHRAVVRPGDDGLPRVRAAVRQHDEAELRDRAEDRRHVVAPDSRCRPPVLQAARRLGTAGAARARVQELGRHAERSTTSVATPICAATSTCSSSATTRSMATPSCASR